MSAPEKVDFASMFGANLTFETCVCGAQSTRKPCWDCVSAADRAAELRAAEERAGIPAQFAWAHPDAAELVERCKPIGRAGEPVRVSQTVQVVRAYAGNAVAFQGQSGAGKTSLAVACLRGLPGALMVAAGALGRARIEHPAGHGEAPLIRRAMAARVLLVDDLGQDKTTAISAVEDVINHRHDARLVTWVTTGLTEDQIESRYGAGVRRRLTERGIALVVRFAVRA